jgi:SAM-dependent methyltransferase
MHVLHAAPGSYGIELEPYQARFAASIGLTVHSRDVIEDDLSDLPMVQCVLALAVIEHVDSPHVFLRKIHGLLEPGGLLILETPCKPAREWLERAPFIGRVHGDHDDHVNAFTARTARFACERAGFRTLALFGWSKPLATRLTGLSPLITGWFPLNVVANGVVYVGAQLPEWQYGPQATRRAARNRRGYVYCGSPFPEKAAPADQQGEPEQVERHSHIPNEV